MNHLIQHLSVSIEPSDYLMPPGGHVVRELRIRVEADGRIYQSRELFPNDHFESAFSYMMRKAEAEIRRLAAKESAKPDIVKGAAP